MIIKIHLSFFRLFMVTEDEWTELSEHFEIDHEIKLNRSIETSSHQVCQPCMAKRVDREKKVTIKHKM